MAISLFQEFRLTSGLLPLANAIEVVFVKSSRYMWIVQQKKVEQHFKKICKLVNYNTEIHSYIEKRRMKKLRGVQAKVPMPWPPVSEITMHDQAT
ncbi:hypothetical protein PVL29_025265 [Vitis rotundifolia]|uniref:Uncharacterized protein n=1 Tax=Vitis rotundifolia TaxID=103349 RepID=A0AA39D669_VITRO|nr:hypothetical protein PVL29_025265 [Vitis rotundifolia]